MVFIAFVNHVEMLKPIKINRLRQLTIKVLIGQDKITKYNKNS